ncbi:hypothetical protein ACW9H6_07115, partial [Pseudomonas sp. SDO528_S397]
MRSLLSTGMTLSVIALLFLAFNLAWVHKLPTIRWDFSEHKVHSLSAPPNSVLNALESPIDLAAAKTECNTSTSGKVRQ